MGVIAERRSAIAAGATAPRGNFFGQVAMLTWRSLTITLRDPGTVIPGFIIGVFFLLVYDASLSGAAEFFLRGQSYLGFVLPLSVISTALSGAGVAGQAIVRDIDNGYFNKLLLTPVNRAAILLGPMIAGAIIIVLQALAIIIAGLVMGLEPATGVLGLLTLLGYALLLGLGLSGFIVGVALRTGSPGAVSGVSFLFFPLTFLTATFTPINLLEGWIRTAAEYNPITYILEATRGLLNTGWDAEALTRGLTSSVVIFVITFAFAFWCLKTRTTRK